MKKSLQKGFTLIELMIVVAIIAILAAIAIPQYQNYMARSQFTAGISEARGGQTAYEEMVNDGRGADITDPEDVGLIAQSERCDLDVTTPDATTGAGTITCELINSNPRVNGRTITLARDTDGHWACSSTLTAVEAERFAPATCQDQT